ncbi:MULTISPECIES: histidine--tRNA ligase [Paenibacillus]|uniref:Histidine--tRNA ligase n=2 Tax=Paenibacillus validus TaxID=44253 RepID=A0A7X2Z7J3_9BACL|nr:MULTISPECIES: histidine--tRNA ligase [Paenibacillus]MED4608397.1 histidine--tRNA ligase [Paenibacillus validus]MUG69185.1 histidine--tRNA ligase [Paenibacillus validus]
MSIQKPKGTQDLLPGEIEKWQYLENKARELCRRFNYREIRTPVFEHTELFQRGVGETTDIVEKEMYTFQDKGDRSISLRPEGTAGVVRAYVENKLYGEPDVSKLYYIGPMFRYEQPQAGRYRQFHQFGIEAFGSVDPGIDAEVIALGYSFYREIGLKDVTVEINSVGNPAVRAAYREHIQRFFAPVKDQLCKDCQSRYDRNPMRILDCKIDQKFCEGAPTIVEHLDEECRTHFQAVQDHLAAMDIPYRLNPRLVRGLDYYTHTAFEYKAAGIGAIDTIGGGGRYNGLVGQIGGNDQPGVGLGLGLERILLVLQAQGVEIPAAKPLDVYLIGLGEAAEKETVKLLQQLRMQGLSAERDYQSRKIKAQMKSADRHRATYVAILGEDELAKGEITVKAMATGEQETLPLAGFAAALAARLRA